MQIGEGGGVMLFPSSPIVKGACVCSAGFTF